MDVIDTGIGISEENIHRIFEEFARVSTDNKQYEGTGLGLTITQKLINLLHGTIHLESKPGEGSRFSVSIPLEPSGEISPLTEIIEPKNEKRISALLSGKKILLIDDDQTLLEMTTMILERAGAQVKSFDDPVKAIRSFKKGDADILITDFQMPKMNGMEVLSIINEINDSPIISIAISGSDELKSKTHGFSAIIRKPFEAQTLIEILSGKINNETDLEVIEPTNEENSPDYDLEQFRAFAGGDSESLRQIMGSFMKSGNQNVQILRQSIHEKDKHAVSELAHKMLPLFRQLKANGIVELLARLEQNGKETGDNESYLTTGKLALIRIEEILQIIQEEENIEIS
jgi:CheY-like chemotaxis protein